MTDDGGVLENLPRSRPGQRSEKRKSGTPAKADAESGPGASRPAKATAKAAAKAERGGTRAARPARGSEPRSAARPKPAAGPRRAAGAAAGERAGSREREAGRPPSRDPVSGTIRAVTGLAGTGARVANGLAREVLRRLPRP